MAINKREARWRRWETTLRLIITVRGVVNTYLRGMVMTFTSTSRADWQTQAHSAGTRRSPGWTLADEREARTAREEEMTTAAHPQTARRRPGAQESQGSPGEAENDAPWGAGDASLPQGHPPPRPGERLVASW